MSARRIIKNTAYLSIGQFSVIGLGVVWMALFSRYTGPKIIGEYAFSQSVLAVMVLFVEVGLQNYIIRTIAQNKKRTGVYLISTIIIKVILSLIVYGIFYLYINYWGWSSELNQMMVAVSITTFLYSINLCIIAVFYAYEIMKYDALGQSLNSIIVLGVGGIFIFLKYDIISILYIIVFASFCRLCLNVWQFRKIKNIELPNLRECIDWRFQLELIKKSFPFALLSMIGVIYSNIIIIILKNFVEEQQLGIFSAAQKLNSYLFIIPQMFMNAIFPALSSSFSESKEKMSKLYLSAFRMIWIFSIPFMVIINVLAQSLILIIYGGEFLRAVVPFQILNLTIINSVGYINGPALNAMGKERFFSFIFGITLIIIIPLNIILAPKYGVYSACITIFLGSLAGLFLYTYFLFKWLEIKIPWDMIIKVVMISAGMWLIIEGVKNQVSTLIVIFVAPIFYLLCMLLFRGFNSSDFLIFSQLIPEKIKKRILFLPFVK